MAGSIYARWRAPLHVRCGGAHVLLYVSLGNFDTIPRETADFLAKGPAWVEELRKANENESTILDKLRGDPRVHCGMSGGAYDLLIAERSATWPACIGWARRKFESYFTQTLTTP